MSQAEASALPGPPASPCAHALPAAVWGSRELNSPASGALSSREHWSGLWQSLPAFLLRLESNGSRCSNPCEPDEPSKLTLGPLSSHSSRRLCAINLFPPIILHRSFFGPANCPYCSSCVNFPSLFLLWPKLLFPSCSYWVQHYINPCPSLTAEEPKHLLPFQTMLERSNKKTTNLPSESR